MASWGTDVRTLAALALSLTVGCATAKAPPPGDPLRPPPQKMTPVLGQERVKVVTGPLEQAPDDCEPVDPHAGPPPKPYNERSTEEAESYAHQGLKMLIDAESQNKPYAEVTVLIEGSVQKFLTSLAADPLNVKATYNLAAAYARIGRNQCSLNLLARLVAMKDFASRNKRQDVPVKGAYSVSYTFDRLFGRGHWAGKPDTDFDNLRQNPKFRELTKGM
jgi:hypothetical protein